MKPGTVMTVTGPVAVEELGITLPHEHLFLDLRNQFTEFDDPEKHRRSHQPVGPEHLAWLQRNPYALKDNLHLDDLALAVQEISRFQVAGGRTVVDCTSIGIHREPEKLRQLALRTGLNIIAGSGYYTQDTHPPDMGQRAVEELADEIVRDFEVGIDGTTVRAGVIGEIGTGNPIHSDELKNLRAAALAQRRTGAPIQVHTYPWGQGGLEAARELLGQGADPGKIVICHADVQPDLGYMRQVLACGVYLEFDDFGKEFHLDPTEPGFAGGAFVTDADRVQALQQLLDAGYGNRLLITNDICLKNMLHAFGGRGYDHVLVTIVPMLLAAGLSRAAVDRLLVDNPRELFQ